MLDEIRKRIEGEIVALIRELNVLLPERIQKAVELGVAGGLFHHTADAAFQADLRGLDSREVVVGIIFHTDDQG